jgi:hypothetical protein
MSLTSGPNFVNNGLVFALDAANLKSFRGEPTTNLARIESDYTGIAYAPENQWSDGTATTTIGKQYDPTIRTPIGFGATILTESNSFGWQTLTRFGGGGSGNFSLSAFVKPIDSDLVTMQIGLLAASNTQLNLQTRQITYNSMPAGPRSGFIEDVLSHPGWLRVGSNLLGRSGGWVGSIGYSVSAYAGSNSKRMYITGIQYETTLSPTRYLLPQTTRGTTVASGGGWADLTGNSNHGELINGPTFNSNGGGSLIFNGINSTIQIPNTTSTTFSANQPYTFEYFIYPEDTVNLTNGGIFSKDNFFNKYAHLSFSDSLNVYQEQTDATITYTATNFFLNRQNTWVHVVVTYDSSIIRSYRDGKFFGQSSSGKTCNANSHPIYIGSNAGTQYFFLGRMANFRMYNRTLSLEEVQQNFNSARGRFGI